MIQGIDYQESFTFKSTYFNLQIDYYLNIIREFHLFLSNNPNLSISDKLSLCRKQRYLIKLYLEQIVKRVDKK